MKVIKEVIQAPAEDDEDYEEWLNDEDGLYFTGVRYQFIGEDKFIEASQGEYYPHDVYIWGWKPNGSKRLNSFRFPTIPYGDSLFENAVTYLVNVENALRITILTEQGYKRVNLNSQLLKQSKKRLRSALRSLLRRG